MSIVKKGSNGRGRTAIDGASKLIPTNVALTTKARNILKRVGNGNLSLGVRRVAAYVHSSNAYPQIRAAID